MRRSAAWLGAAACVAAAVAYALGVIRPAAEQGRGLPNYDIYAYFYPNARYALDSLARGTGLLWNPYQDCGQPFFALSLTAMLYPINWVFAVLPREPALLTSMVLNMSIGGMGAWWLAREMGLSRAAALAGALAFELGGSGLYLAAWGPMHIAPYAWLPAALAAVERLLRAPSPRGAVLLALLLTLQLLPGFPQVSVFTYQVVALRVVWELVSGRMRRPFAVLALLGLGLVLAPLLAAVQLIPALEVARDSVRMLPLRPQDMGGTGMSLADFRASLGRRSVYPGAVLSAAAIALAGVGFCGRTTRRPTLFYLVVAVGYFLLAMGEHAPLLDLYRRLPGGNAFRGPDRFVWVTSFALAMLAALGIDATTRAGAPRGDRSLAAASAALAAGAALFWWLSPNGMTTFEVGALLAIAASVVVASRRPRLGGAAALVMTAVLAVGGLRGFTPALSHRVGDLYEPHAQVLERVRALLTPMDRVAILGWKAGYSGFDVGLTHKIAMLHRLPSIYDYEPQISLRYAQYVAFMRSGQPVGGVGDWYDALGSLMLRGIRRPLFDLTAARYVIVDARIDDIRAVLGHTAEERFRVGDVVVYENTSAQPRAFFVANMERVADGKVLPMLGYGRVDPRHTALVGVGAGAAGGRTGSDGSGNAAIVRDDPQDVEIAVEADAPGFLFLADQYAPGWTAEVDSAPAEILRANHAFRLVAVPAGRSRVAFRYRPLSLRIGAAVSLAAVLLAVAICAWDRRAPTRNPGGSLARGDLSVPPIASARTPGRWRPWRRRGELGGGDHQDGVARGDVDVATVGADGDVARLGDG